MRHIRIVRKCCDNLISVRGRILRDTFWQLSERGKEEQSSSIKGGAALARNAQRFNGSGGTDNDGLLAAQENTKTFFFDRRLKATDDRNACITHNSSGVKGTNDSIAGRSNGAEERGSSSSEDCQRAYNLQDPWCVLAESFGKKPWPVLIRWRERSRSSIAHSSSPSLSRPMQYVLA